MYFFYKIVLLLCMCGSVFQFSVFAQYEDRSYQLSNVHNPGYGVEEREQRIQRVNNVPFVWRINGLVSDDAVDTMRDRAWNFYLNQHYSGNVLTARLYFDGNHQGVFDDNGGYDVNPNPSLYSYENQDQQEERRVFTSRNVRNGRRISLYGALRVFLSGAENIYSTYTDTEMVAVCALLGVAVEGNRPSERAERSALVNRLLDVIPDHSVNRMAFVLYSRLDPCWHCSTLLRNFAGKMNNINWRFALFHALYNNDIAKV